VQTALRSYQSSTSAGALNLQLHPKQWVAFETPATEVLYGGAAGGGKSHLMRISAVVWCSAIPGLQVYLFRRIRDDLVKNHMEGPKGFRAMLAGWVQAGWCVIVDDEIRFWNGSKIYLCHCKDEKDIYKYQGAEIHVLLIDELTHFTESMYRFLRNRVRMVGLNVPKEYAGMFPRILCGANPGNIGHLWVKTTFVIAAEPMSINLMPAVEGGMRRQYIPARLEDNPSMTDDDPGYEMRLEGLGSETLVRAMRWGDWDVIEGAFFDCWDPRRHIIRPFEIPKDWTRSRSGDWGSAKPFSFGWWAVVGDDYRASTSYGPILLPRGCLVRYREWYGCQPGKPNTGLKMHAEPVGKELWRLEEKDPKIADAVLDPAAFSEDGGPSISERISVGSGNKIFFRPADNKRVPGRGAMGGWDQMRGRLVGDADGNPMIVCFSICVDSIRTIPALQHDQDKPEDLDTEAEDHAADEWRYECMSRPWVRNAEPPAKSKNMSGFSKTSRSSAGSLKVL
jgi:hypothetical protein